MAVVGTIINHAIGVANLKAAQSEAYGGQAFLAAAGGHQYSFKTPDKESAKEPSVYVPNRASGLDQALWNSTYDRIIDDLSDKFANFFVEFFPIDAALMQAVEDWLTKAITQGGTGINSTVEARIWQRDRDRISAEAAAATDEALAAWAARGFPLPPGAANATVQAIAAKRATDVAAVSRDAAIKAFETEIENVRFAITSAIDYRKSALAAAGDYLRALALGPQLATQLATSSSDAQARLISAATGLYNARISAAELAQRRGIAIMDAELRQTIAAGDNKVRYTDMKVRAALETMQSLGQQAAAALNGINATSQLIESAG